jgi:hypothetical protein
MTNPMDNKEISMAAFTNPTSIDNAPEGWYVMSIDSLCKNTGSTGTNVPRTSWNEMVRYPLAIPLENAAKAFTAQVGPAIEKIIVSIYESRTLAALRDALLPRLIGGQISVGYAENSLMECRL